MTNYCFFPHITEPGPQEEDELYEMYMAETNRVYRYENETLVPYEEYWGTTPKYEMLNNKAVGAHAIC